MEEKKNCPSGHAFVSFQSIAVGSDPKEVIAKNGSKYLKFKVKCRDDWFYLQAWEGTEAFDAVKRLKLRRGKVINCIAEMNMYSAPVISPEIWPQLRDTLQKNVSSVTDEKTKEWISMMQPLPIETSKTAFKLMQVDYAIPYGTYEHNKNNAIEAENLRPKPVTEELHVSGFGD